MLIEAPIPEEHWRGPAASGYYPCQQISSIKQRHFKTLNRANILSQVLEGKQFLTTKNLRNIGLRGTNYKKLSSTYLRYIWYQMFDFKAYTYLCQLLKTALSPSIFIISPVFISSPAQVPISIWMEPCSMCFRHFQRPRSYIAKQLPQATLYYTHLHITDHYIALHYRSALHISLQIYQ